jgi:ABC-type glycerol-3-phosphate transport system substrate-binding protein
VKTSYEMIFQQYGWEKGWSIMTRLFANAAMVRDNGGAPADDVGSADAVAGIVIDFYGRLAAVRAGEKIEGFVIPEGGTVLDADPIGLLKGAPHAELAAQFIRFVISPEGQKIWVLRAGAPGGPRKSSLGRLSVLEELYKTEGPNLFDPKDPFDPGSGKALKMNGEQQRARNAFMGDVIKAALIDNHAALVRARKAIKQKGDAPELLAKLVALPRYRPSRIQKDVVAYGDLKIIREGDQADVAAEWAPPKDDPRGPFAERIQNQLKDDWRKEFARRFAEIEQAAQ